MKNYAPIYVELYKIFLLELVAILAFEPFPND